jgi:hypothetical protein
MAIGLWISFADGTQSMYEAINEKMGVEENPPEGLIFHAAWPQDGGGWNVVDFWESREHFDRFQENLLGPALASLGDEGPSGPPNVKEFPVHNVIKGS